MAEPSALVTAPEHFANQVDLGCKPGEGGHTGAPCVRCEQLRARIAEQVGAAQREMETIGRAKSETIARGRVDATKAWARVLHDNEQLRAAFAALRIVFDLDPAEAGRIAHEAWITRMLADGYHPFTECLVEQGCPKCDMELMAWDALPEARRLVREAGVTALFAELRRRAKLDAIDASREAGRKALEELRKPTTTEGGPGA